MATKGADTTPAENIPAPAIPADAAAQVPAPAPGVDDKPLLSPIPNHIETDEPSTMEDVSLNSPAPPLAVAAASGEPATPIPAKASDADNEPVVAATPQVPETITTSESAATLSSDTGATAVASPASKKDDPLEPLAAALESSMITEPPKRTDLGELPAKSSLEDLYGLLPTILKDAEHSEMWGVELDPSTTHIPTTIVLQKFLRANHYNPDKARLQLTDALKWRKKMEPVKLVDEGEYAKEKFGGLGYVTTYGKDIVTWNIYGAVKDTKATFGDVDEFMKWRTAVMELSLRSLNLNSATTPLVAGEPDPYQMIQVHDYSNVSFIRMDPAIKACSKATISAFAIAYPELLSRKFFVNVPLVMSWVFQAAKLFVAKETVRKFSVLGYGSNLAGELGEVGDELPALYGGKGGSLEETGKEVKLV